MTEEKKSQGKPKRIHTYGKRDTHAEEMPIFEFQIFKMRNNDIWKIRNNNSNNKLANYTGFSIIWNHPLDQCLSAAHCTKFSVLHFQAPVFSVAYLVLSRSMRWPVFIIIFYIIIYIFRFVIVICSMICCVCVCVFVCIVCTAFVVLLSSIWWRCKRENERERQKEKRHHSVRTVLPLPITNRVIFSIAFRVDAEKERCKPNTRFSVLRFSWMGKISLIHCCTTYILSIIHSFHFYCLFDYVSKFFFSCAFGENFLNSFTDIWNTFRTLSISVYGPNNGCAMQSHIDKIHIGKTPNAK